MAMGDAMAKKAKEVLEEAGISVDVVIPVRTGFFSFEGILLRRKQVPDTSRVAALNLAQKLNLPYREGFIKNRYVGRTFIMPGQLMRSSIIIFVQSKLTHLFAERRTYVKN
jgi:amidophosphoribosyltransferase